MTITKIITSITMLAMATIIVPTITQAASHGGNAAVKKDKMAKDAMMKKDEMAKDAMMKKDEMAKDAAMKKDAMAKDAMMKKDEMAKDAAMKKDAMAKDAMMKKDEMAKDAMMTSHYVIKSGDSLWTIAQGAYGDGAMWTKIMAANSNIDADRLIVGKTINLPK